MEAFRQALRQLGFVEGQNMAIELRYARGGLQQLPELATELVRLKPDVLFAPGDLAPRIAQQATNTIPIVAMSDDILGARLVTSLSHPGGNTTGLTIMAPELSAKRLEVLQEMAPGMARVAALWDPTTGASQVELTERAAKALKLDLQVLEVRRRDDVSTAFRQARDGRADAINVFSSPFLASLFREIIILSAEYRLPAIYQWPERAEGGGFAAYAPRFSQIRRELLVRQVVQLLRGAKIANIPVEQPTKFELVINLKTAKAIGHEIPANLVLRADKLVE